MVMVLESREATGVGIGKYHQALVFPADPFLQMGKRAAKRNSLIVNLRGSRPRGFSECTGKRHGHLY